MTVDVEAIMAYAKRFTDEKRIAFRECYGLDAEDVVFIYVGRLEPYKCITQLMYAFQDLVSTNRSAKLLLVGDGSLRETVTQWAQTNDWLVTPGRLDGEELLTAYLSADAFVLPSEFEPWGLVVNEAMAASLPVIISNRVGCVDDLVVGKDTGIVYDFDGSDELLAALRLMLEDPLMRRRTGENARRLISGWTLAEEASRIMKAWSGVV
jgi:glycosyltransferase involved in cell wall biosynthesis